jgi:hypothetical protein
VALICARTETLLDVWHPSQPSDIISVAASNRASQVMIAVAGYTLVLLEVVHEKLVLVTSRQMPFEISCLNLNPGMILSLCVFSFFLHLQFKFSFPFRSFSVFFFLILTCYFSAIYSTCAVLRVFFSQLLVGNAIGGKSPLCAVGLWTEISVKILSLPKLEGMDFTICFPQYFMFTLLNLLIILFLLFLSFFSFLSFFFPPI